MLGNVLNRRFWDLIQLWISPSLHSRRCQPTRAGEVRDRKNTFKNQPPLWLSGYQGSSKDFPRIALPPIYITVTYLAAVEKLTLFTSEIPIFDFANIDRMNSNDIRGASPSLQLSAGIIGHHPRPRRRHLVFRTPGWKFFDFMTVACTHSQDMPEASLRPQSSACMIRISQCGFHNYTALEHNTLDECEAR
jgi:hypothetical protein